ncbi:MAG TPA: Dabb family protein [Solirubrobacterales bacterium]|jgi:Stress responsive A/B Barrel Domain|nr:Dabb family protein [Solirubrobacterales bacterium]
MLCHTVTYRFREGVGEDRVADLVARLERLPELIETIREYRFGPDLGLTEGAGDFAIVAVFEDADGWRAYRDHPSHLEVVELIGEMIEARTPVQFELRQDRG